jgi:hypothetical protein
MPYQKGKARLTFETDISRELLLLRRASASKVRDVDLRGYLLSSIIAKGSVALELYLEKIFSDWFSKIQSVPAKNRLISGQLRVFLLTHKHVNDHLLRFLAMKDEGIYLDAVGGSLGAPEWRMFDDAANVPNTDMMSVIENRRYPSPKNIRRVFRRIGIPNVFAQLNAAGRTDIEALIRSYNDVRNDFAHDGVIVGVNAADVRKKLRDLGRIVNAVDRVMHRFVYQTCGAAFWTV